MIKDSRILITGGAGFIGSHLAERLCKDNWVVVLDDFSTGVRSNIPNDCTLTERSILDKQFIRELIGDFDYIFHLAADVGNIKSIDDPIYDMNVNILGTLNLLEACKDSKIKKFVYSSSSAVYGEPVALPISEDHPVNPDSPYAVSKLAAEKYCLAYNKIFDIPTIALRYFNVYGPRQGHSEYANVVPVFFENAKAGKDLIIFGDGEQTRDFVNVKDIVEANILAAESDISDVFNIATGEAITIEDLADEIIWLTGRKLKIIYKLKRIGEVKHSTANINKAYKDLGYARWIGIEEGLKEYYEYYAN